LAEIILVLELECSIKIRDSGSVEGSGRVGTSSKVSDKLDAWVVAFESTIELCMGGELGEATYGEEWEESAELGTTVCEFDTNICGSVFVGVVYFMFLRSKMSSELLDVLGLELLLLLSSFWLKKNSRIFVFLFKSLFFLITFLGFSMLLYSSRSVELGFWKANADVFSVLILCLDNPRRFLLINSESAGEACGSGSLVMKTVWSRGSGVRKFI
jgi:hypothetical protein